jgi:signal transduction histidine kinase
MRIVPRSIAARTTWILVLGLIVTLLVSVAVFSLDIFGGTGPRHYRRVIEQVVTIAKALERTPREMRPALAKSLETAQIEVVWQTAQPPPTTATGGWLAAHFRGEIARAFHGSSAEILLEQDSPKPGSMRLARTFKPFGIWIKLNDGSWLKFHLEQEFSHGGWLVRFIVSVTVLMSGIALLAIWAARKVTQPLEHFAAQAARLGVDVNAPPMEERGPSEISLAAGSFNLMQQRIQRLLEDRTLMLAAVSHDLRTVLTRLRMRSEYIAEQQQRERARADLEEMQTMLSATLAYAKGENDPEPREKVDLAALLQTLCDDFTDAGKSAHYDGPLHFIHECRPVALRRAISNLVDNAVHYGKEALVRLSSNDTDVITEVADRGPGIAPDLREKVFAPFFRVEPSRSRDSGGAGLGLAIARAVVRRHGGDIALSAREGGGLLVRVVLPRDV